jgi:hypothetical protein
VQIRTRASVPEVLTKLREALAARGYTVKDVDATHLDASNPWVELGATLRAEGGGTVVDVATREGRSPRLGYMMNLASAVLLLVTWALALRETVSIALIGPIIVFGLVGIPLLRRAAANQARYVTDAVRKALEGS